MSQQSIAPDGGIVSKPRGQFDRNPDAYQYIDERLSRTWSAFCRADRESQIEALRASTEYAIISVQTNVDRHEPAFVKLHEADDPPEDEIADILAETAVQYYNNKARYIAENRASVDFGEIVDYLPSDVDKAHQRIAEECLGLGPAKAAFSLCMLGVTDLMCIDSHTATMAGLDRTAGSDIDLEEYRNLQKTVYQAHSDLSDRTSPFLYQWLCFDADRGHVETHDPYYLVIGDVLNHRIV